MLTNERIVEEYRLSAIFLEQSKLSNIQESIHWKDFNRKKQISLEGLEDFRAQDGLSKGLDDFFAPWEWQQDIDYWLTLMPEDFIRSHLYDSPLGFGIGESLIWKGKYVDFNKLHSIYWLYLIEKVLGELKKPLTFLEIGGGSGLLPNY